MQNIENNQNAAFNHIALGNLSIARLSASAVVGGIITFALFAAMHALIDQGNVRPAIEKPIVIVSSILDIPEEKLILRPTIKPLPKITPRPITRVELPLDPSGTSSFSEAIEIPSVGTEKLSFEIGAVNQQPRPIVRFTPKYPVPAASKGLEGFVSLSFGVSPIGEVVDIKIIEAQPRNTFERAAKQALRKWRYQPKMENGSAVGMDGLQVRLDFNLTNN